MKDFKTRVLSANYGKHFRLLIAAGLCIFLIGGGASMILLHTLDADAFARGPQMQQNNSMPGENGGNGTVPGNDNGNAAPGINDNGNAAPGINDNSNAGQFGGHRGHGPMNNGDQTAPSQDNQTAPSQDNGTQSQDNNKDNSTDTSKDSNSQDANAKGTTAQYMSFQTVAGNTGSGDMQSRSEMGGAGGRGGFGNIGGHNDMGGRDDFRGAGGHGIHHGGFLRMLLSNSQISPITKIVVLVTTVLGILWALLVWFTIVCYLYRSSTFSGMNPMLWTVLGVIGSILTLIAFFIVRSFVKTRCENCGAWQDMDQAYCASCGSTLRRECPGCGTSVAQSAAFCPSCGKSLGASADPIH